MYLTAIGLTESLMTLQKIDSMLPDSPPGNGMQEVAAQGVANLVPRTFSQKQGLSVGVV